MTIITPRSAATERFYVDAIWRVQEAAKAGIPPETVFTEMGAEAALFNKALTDPAFKQAAMQALQAKLPELAPENIESRIGEIFAVRMRAQQDLFGLAGDEAFQDEVGIRAATTDGINPKLPLVATQPACMLLLPEEPASWVKRYAAQPAAAAMMESESRVQKALEDIFGGSDHPLEQPLIEALKGPQVTTSRTAEDLADSFLSARTKEAMDRVALLAPGGWVQTQLPQQSWVVKAVNPPTGGWSKTPGGEG